MQISFFSEAIPLVEEALGQLQRFEFDACLNLLQQAQEIDPTVANAEYYREIALWCREGGLTAHSTAQEIVEIWQELKHQMTEVGGAGVAIREKCKLFAQRLRILDDFDRDGCVADCDYFLHEGACALHDDKFQAAYDLLLDALQTQVDTIPARYWGYFGDAATALHKLPEANTAYVKLLANDPFELDWTTLKNKNLRAVFSEIAGAETVEAAYGKLPYFAWVNEAIYLPERNTFIPEILRRYADHPESFAELPRARKTYIFALYAFDEQLHKKRPVDLERRKVMHNLAPDLFTHYLRFCHK